VGRTRSFLVSFPERAVRSLVAGDAEQASWTDRALDRLRR
jgi:hypothetical protein